MGDLKTNSQKKHYKQFKNITNQKSPCGGFRGLKH